MAKVPRAVLKEYFQTGDKPTQPQFSTMLDSMVNIVDDRSFIGLRDYDPALEYLPGDCAVFNNQIIKCITATTGVFNPANWTILAAFGSVTYAGTWDTQNNNPALQSSVGTKGFYYVVINASSDPNDNTTLNGINDWGTGDWAIFDGSVWEKVDNSESPVVASGVSFNPFGPITAVNVQTAVEEVFNDLDNTKLNAGGGTMSGPLILSGDPTNALGAATKAYVDAGDSGMQTQINGKVNRSGDTMTGDLILNADPTAALGAVTKQYVDAIAATKLDLSGGTLTGNLILNGDPTTALGATTKQYTDAIAATKLNLSGGTLTGNLILNGDPVAALGAVTKQYADALAATKLNITGGTLTGNLILNGNPTTSLGAATKQYVDTADATLQTQVNSKLSLSGGQMTGLVNLSGDPIVNLGAATKQYVDNNLGNKLNLTGGTLTGPLILNANPGTALGAATKQYVDTAVSAIPSATRAIAIPLTFSSTVQGFSSASWSRFPTAASQLRVVIPAAGTLFPGTTSISVKFVLDYLSPTGTGLNIALYDFTNFPATAPFETSSQSLATTNNAWQIFTTPAFSISGTRTFEIIGQRTGAAGTAFVESLTLLVTYS